MKKICSVIVLSGVLFGCDSNAGEAVAQNGDKVIIDFAGYLNGVAFDGGTASNYPLVLGSGQFVPGFEDQVIGMRKGEERDVNITFPQQYVPNLAGKDVVFKVKLVDVVR